MNKLLIVSALTTIAIYFFISNDDTPKKKKVKSIEDVPTLENEPTPTHTN